MGWAIRHYQRGLLIGSAACTLVVFTATSLSLFQDGVDEFEASGGFPSWSINMPVLLRPAAPKLNSTILVCVPSAPNHANRRQAIRDTWGATPKLQILFVLGIPQGSNASEIQHSVEFESEVYGDVLQLDFDDNYRNLTLKSIGLVQWAKKWRWPSRRLVIKTDDDVFVNTPLLFNYVDHFTDGNMYGRQLTDTKPQRCKRSGCNHTELTKDEFSPDVFPPYLQGLFYIITETALDRIYEHLFDPPFVFIEDLYITGLVSVRAGVSRCAMPKTTNINDAFPDSRTLVRLWKDLLVQHGCDPRKQRYYWRRIRK